jgi:thymidylate synthase
MVLPGDYTVKLKVGDKVYSKPVKLVHDVKNKDFTLEDRQLQYKTAMELYKLHEQLAATVDQINDKQRMLKENISKLKDTASKKVLQDYTTKLEDLRSTLLATKQKSLFADEKKLREEISDVYTAVCGQEARPSNLQVQRVTQLVQNVAKAEEKRVSLVKQYDAMVETALSKEGLPAKEASKPAKTF